MNLRISRVLHAGYIFECFNVRILFDPIFENPFSKNCYAFPAISFDIEKLRQQSFQAIFISHYHDDHFSLDSLALLDRNTPIFAYCIHDELFTMIRELGFSNVTPLQIDLPVAVGPFTVTPRRALDWDVDSLFQIEAAGYKILNVVDSWIDAETLQILKKLSPWDLVLWPYQTMREIEVLSPRRAEAADRKLPQEWVEQLKILQPKYLVPSSCQFRLESWSWYNTSLFPISYKSFASQVSDFLPRTKTIRMNPGEARDLCENGFHLSNPVIWITPIGDQSVDYSFFENQKIPTTSEIAKNFLELDSIQTERVCSYCVTELIQKFNSLEHPEDSYMRKINQWKLKLHFGKADCIEFNYNFERGKIKSVAETRIDKPGFLTFGWLTEIPISKLYGALEFGEALTSLYLRVNDFEFAEGIESELQKVDPIQDPLIQSLYNGNFGSYQRAQLRRLVACKKD